MCRTIFEKGATVCLCLPSHRVNSVEGSARNLFVWCWPHLDCARVVGIKVVPYFNAVLVTPEFGGWDFSFGVSTHLVLLPMHPGLLRWLPRLSAIRAGSKRHQERFRWSVWGSCGQSVPQEVAQVPAALLELEVSLSPVSTFALTSPGCKPPRKSPLIFFWNFGGFRKKVLRNGRKSPTPSPRGLGRGK